MAVNPNQELIWQGRIHLGDEPGIYGDAYYNGICAELPITIYRLEPTQIEDKAFKLILETENVKTYPGYPGHEISVFIYEPDPNQQDHSVERKLASSRLTDADNNRKEIEIQPGTAKSPFWLTVKLRNDTSVNPGLYDDFVWVKLSLLSDDFTYYASFGFINS